MSQPGDYFYLQINEHRSGNSARPILPIGFFKMQTHYGEDYDPQDHYDAPSRLADLRLQCTQRGFMTQYDEFLFHPSSQDTRMMYQVSAADESRISVEEYLGVSSRFTGTFVMPGV